MAIGAYTMGILVVKADWSFWLALPAAMLVAIAFGLLIGLPSLRLRADYFAIATIAAAEIVRITAQNARELTGGNQGLSCNDEETSCYYDTWTRRLRHDRGVARVGRAGATPRPSSRCSSSCG